MSDWNELIQRVLKDELVDTTFTKSVEPWKNLFGMDTTRGGDRHTEEFLASWTSSAAAYTKGSNNPAVASNVLIKPHWDKLFYHAACEVHGIDLSNAQSGGSSLDLVREALKHELAALMDVIYSSFWTQVALDVDSSGTAYSDKSLSRSTYATLSSYEEASDTTITIPLMQEFIRQTMLNKSCGPKSGYVGILEESVYVQLRKLAAAVHSWNFNDTSAGQKLDMGYQEMESFEGLKIANPVDFPGMTTGICYMLRKQDVKLKLHRPLEIVKVEANADVLQFVLRIGMDMYIIHPGFQGKMTDKD